MKPTPPEKEINRIEQELDESKPPGENPRVKGNDGAGGRGQPWKPGKKSLDAVVTSALLLFVVSAALAFAGRLSPQQRMQLTAGSAGGAVGLLIGYGIGRLRP